MTKTTKKKAGANRAGRYSHAQISQTPKPKPLAQALKEFDGVFIKAHDLREVLVTGNPEVTAYRASRLTDLANEVVSAAYFLRDSAKAEAEK